MENLIFHPGARTTSGLAGTIFTGGNSFKNRGTSANVNKMETDFNVGDCVCVGASGEKGKIVDIYKPLGTYKMYKVQSYTTGDMVKGLPDEMFNIIFEEAFQDEIDDNIIDTLSFTVAQNLMTSNDMPQQTSGSDASVNENAPSQLQMNPPSPPNSQRQCLQIRRNSGRRYAICRAK